VLRKFKNNLKKLYKSFGPGFITGASDDDPAGIATYSQTGAAFGYSQLWLSLFTFPFMTAVQNICGKIGMVTQQGLASVIKTHYTHSLLYFVVSLLLIANTINIGADLGAMASSTRLLVDIPYSILLVFFAVLSAVLPVIFPYKTYVRYLKYLTLSLFAYVFVAFLVDQPWRNVFMNTLIPQVKFSQSYLLNVVAILGTTISPYLFFWQASEEVEEAREHHLLTKLKSNTGLLRKSINEMKIDTSFGMFFSNLVMFFIILTTASTLNVNGITNIETASQAAEALRPFAGDFTFFLFAMGVIGTGLLAVPVLAASASYAVSESFGWHQGLNKKYNQAQGFYIIIIASILVGMLINFLHIPPFKMLYYSAVVNGICAPPILVLIMLVSSNKKIMGKYANSKRTSLVGWTVTILMGSCAVFLLLTLL
jgi:NRAMP (natural resistance-associated macrophage protein)-like metal ion transporter